MAEWCPPDAEARARIASDLSASLLVEAGAGSGKTTAMVGRMVALVRTGAASADQIAAVTFTRKAAGELRERFQEALERAFHASAGTAPAERARLGRALRDLDSTFVGTIHAFCAAILRERPFEAGVAPGFREVSGADEERTFTEGWARFREHLDAHPSRLPAALERVGLRPAQLRGLFREVAAQPDVRFIAPAAPRPDESSIAAVRAALETLLDDSLRIFPAETPGLGWDALQQKVLSLRCSRRIPGWRDTGGFFDALATALLHGNDVTQNRWGDDRASTAAAKTLAARWTAFAADGSPAHALLAAWLAHRYPPALRLARAAAAFCARERRRAGDLTFDDLLVLTARLLRRSESARRQLGARWRFLLVDEFQDTDPLQAEVIFLLAERDPAVAEWRAAVPRDGALFVVGDPRQSIYRFRRADLAVYDAVRARFGELGGVLQLTANFRSGPAVAAFVNTVFGALLPAVDHEPRPEFSPMRVRPSPRRHEGVGWYSIEPEPGRGRASGRRMAVPDAAALASWIAVRIASGARTPGDFLVLTRTTHHLAGYARALEAAGISVRLSGAGIEAGEVLGELLLLLRALCDPGDAVLTVAVLEGLFFGLSHDDLHAHASAGAAFSFVRDPPATTEVSAALTSMRELWRITRALPPDAAIPAIVDRIGLLPYAAGGEWGSVRAGALLFALDAVRAASPRGACSLAETVDALEAAMRADADPPPLSGDERAVRVMNLHKAKGLEAPVVVLAYPADAPKHAPKRHVERGTDGIARGHLLVTDSTRRGPGELIARPARWDAYATAEAVSLAAEEVRLLYVAATRAMDELVIARCEKTADRSAWTPFHAALDDPALAAEVRIAPIEPTTRPEVEGGAAPIVARAAALAERRRELARPSYVSASVSSIARRGEPAPPDEATTSRAPGRGAAWGTAVHRALAAAARDAAGDTLRAVCRAALIDTARPVNSSGEPAELDELLALVAAIRASPLWYRAAAAEHRLAEVPFAIRLPPRDAAVLRVAGDGVAPDASSRIADIDGVRDDDGRGGCDVLVEGVVDLAFRERGAWTLVDYKTGAGDAPADHARISRYRRQLDLYAACWERITGEPVAGRVVVLAGAGRELAW